MKQSQSNLEQVIALATAFAPAAAVFAAFAAAWASSFYGAYRRSRAL